MAEQAYEPRPGDEMPPVYDREAKVRDALTERGASEAPGLTTMDRTRRVRVDLRCDGCGTWERWQTPNPDLKRHDFDRAHMECGKPETEAGRG